MAKYFTRSEFDCRCGCGFNNWDTDAGQRFVRGLDRARKAAGIPFSLNRGCSCPEHNASVGGSPTSSHMLMAADIKADTSEARFRIVKALLDTGFDRVFLYHDKGIVHVDDDPDKPHPAIRAY